ncbi:hypothetical protein HanIR_Chr17g0872191 [Helianthus annuus]|nr:hypothetical protein HanIR_Chr17g0872191 [Helianthus annuus]
MSLTAALSLQTLFQLSPSGSPPTPSFRFWSLMGRLHLSLG